MPQLAPGAATSEVSVPSVIETGSAIARPLTVPEIMTVGVAGLTHGSSKKRVVPSFTVK